MQAQTKLMIWIAVTIVGLTLLIALMPFTQISAGERGVVLRWGSVNRTLDTGLHWITPIVEGIEKIDVTIQKVEDQSDSSSKDMQTVSTKIALNYRPDPEFVSYLWTEFHGEYRVRLIDPSILESVKASTALYTAEELITKRELVKEEIKKNLREKLTPHHLMVIELNIVDFNFSPDFNRAIEAKVTAEQQALAAKNKLEQVKFEASQRVAQAEGEARAIQIQAQAIQNQGGAEYVRLKTIEKWNGILPQNLYGSAPIPFLNVNQ